MSGAGHTFRKAMPPLLFHFLFQNGNNGVTVFFAISGFLITLTSLRRFGTLANMDALRFYRIRFARIAPLLILVVAALSLLHVLHFSGFVIDPHRTTLPRAVLAAFTFHLNWLEAAHGWLPPNWDVLWSLSVEEMFYLFFPLICLVAFRKTSNVALFTTLLLVFVVLGPFARTIWAFNEIWAEKTYLGGMDCIAMGCLTALYLNRIPRLGNLGLALIGIAGCAAMLLILVWPPWSVMRPIGRSGIDTSILALGTCLVIIATVESGFDGGRVTLPIRWLGRLSYEVYMTHEFLVVWMTLLYARTLAAPQWLWVIAISLLACLLGAVTARYVSEPLNARLRGVRTQSVW